MSEGLDWVQAEKWLDEIERAYREIGPLGSFALHAVILPARRRLERGERTRDLYDEIMGIE